MMATTIGVAGGLFVALLENRICKSANLDYFRLTTHHHCQHNPALQISNDYFPSFASFDDI
jgi:hypothetical protein